MIQQNSPFRIGASAFLDGLPLTADLREDSQVDFREDLPARLADLLYENRIDAGLIPVVEYLRGVGGQIVPGICISSKGPMRSVKVFSRIPLEEATGIAVDRASRSSVALLRILLMELYGTTPDFHIHEPCVEKLFQDHSTVLVIGDRAERIKEDGLHIYDLGRMWDSYSGLPFVFSVWVLSAEISAEPDASRRDALVQRLGRAREAGSQRLAKLAIREAALRGVSSEGLLDTWKKRVGYELGESQQAGLNLFATLAAKHNLCPPRESVFIAQA